MLLSAMEAHARMIAHCRWTRVHAMLAGTVDVPRESAMRPFLTVFVACVLSACSGPAPSPAAPTREVAAVPMTAAPQSRAIPERFRGRYAATRGQCNVRGSEGALAMHADHVDFHESSGPVLRAWDEGDVLHLRLHLSGEGTAREADYTFRAEDGGNTLLDLGSGFRRVRCQ